MDRPPFPSSAETGDDGAPPICPACGVTMGIVIDDRGAAVYACLECGFDDVER